MKDQRTPSPGNPTPQRGPVVGDIVHCYGPRGEGPHAGIIARLKGDDEPGDQVFVIDVPPPRWGGLPDIGVFSVKRSPTGEPMPGCWNWPR